MTLSFGAFLPSFHTLGENPTTALWRDLELIEWLDTLGFDEVWVGEQHSGGWGLISSPEVFLAAAAERTRRIRLGTGVVSLPYHHPLSVAERMVQLDHQSRGRAMLGMGSGASPLDADARGISPRDQGRMMAESVDVLVRLLTGKEPVTHMTDWFELRDAALQLRPYSTPCFDMAIAASGSDRGMRLAGRYGLSSLTSIGRPGAADPPLADLWQAAEGEAHRHGTTVDRSAWRVSIAAHVAETRQEAFAQVRPGMSRWFQEYIKDTARVAVKLPAGREAEAAVESRIAIIGSVDDAVQAIEQLLKESGGFGTLLVNTQDWASREHTKHSFELLARYVVPHFNASLEGLRASQRHVAENIGRFSAKPQGSKT
ncbi:LLM class flavin-dependent oxidoreductase [Streptomyces spongiae]|uniref:LLM class flavin-dependent oxidoreductase n=1 Tax=Streptomyces spongiae TaxID=565072 RepID=A0A5N8XLN4_9ACTN|nr:LLM class flavin-dependent oxidoreductase [Streptomyces spongiae]MPY60361.1 LLM class flavin-dependent oxidoreductase [Streptomyces spongiae]